MKHKKEEKVTLLVLILLLTLSTGMFYHNKNQKNDLEHVINTALHIQYGWENIGKLKDICTEEFLETAELDVIYLGRKFYSVDPNYEDYEANIREISDDKVEISVMVYSPEMLIHKFTLVKVGEEGYLISSIEHDG